MQRGISVVSWFVLSALLILTPGLTAQAASTADLVAQACDASVNANVRSAASDAVSARWLENAPDPADLFKYVNDPSAPAECRAMGFEAQIAEIFDGGDPNFGVAIQASLGEDEEGPTPAQQYADGVAEAATPEYAYLLGTAVARFARDGFAIVPGGLGESLNRLQTCLDGSIETNQDNQVAGVSIDCGVEGVRRAIADSIATSFFVFFRDNPAVALSCDDLLTQAEGGATVESRWASAKAYVFDEECTANTAEALSALATSGGSAELKQAAVRSLAELWGNSGTSARELLFNASNGATAELRQAAGWAAGFALLDELGVDNACNATTPTTGVLSLWASVVIDGVTAPSEASIIPLARFNVSDVDDSNQGLSCSVDVSTSELRVRLSRSVSGADMPLQSFFLLR